MLSEVSAWYFHHGIFEVWKLKQCDAENEDRKHEYLKYLMRFAQLPPKVATKQYFVAQ